MSFGNNVNVNTTPRTESLEPCVPSFIHDESVDTGGFQHIAPELLVAIFANLDDGKDVCSAARVCRSWNAAALVAGSWKNAEAKVWRFPAEPSGTLLLAKEVTISCKKLSRSITDADIVKHFSEVEELFLDHFKGYGKGWEALHKLRSLILVKCPNIGMSLSKLTQLEELDLTRCGRVYDAALFGLTKLKSLELEDMSKIGGNCFAKMLQLEELCLENCPDLSGHHLHSIPRLMSLEIDECPRLTASDVIACQHLTKLDVYHKNVRRMNKQYAPLRERGVVVDITRL